MELSKKGFAKRHIVTRDEKTHKVKSIARVAREKAYDRQNTNIRSWRGHD